MNRLLARLNGHARYHYYDEYSKLQWLPSDVIREHQFILVKDMLKHCYTTVPYYRALLTEHKIKPEDIRTFADYSLVPFLTKDIIRQNGNNILSSSFFEQDLITNRSGGSTGQPLTFYHDHEIYEIMEANGMLGYSMAGWNESDPLYYFWGNPREFQNQKTLKTKLKEKLSGRYTFNSYSYNEEKIAGWADKIKRSEGVFLYGYTSVLTDIARYVESKCIRITSVKGVFSTAEKLYPWQRELMERSFGTRVFDQYGSREVPGIACECREGNMHLLSHSAYIEFIDDPTVPDSRKIVVTGLTNFAMPFIRYEIGDYGRPKEGSCSCGRGFPMMEMDIGRTTDCFVTPEGNMVYGTFFVRQMYGQDRVTNFQFHQTAPDKVVLSVVRSAGFTDEDSQRLDKIQQIIHDQASPLMQLSIRYLDEIPRTQAGKHRFVISDVAR